MIIADPALVIMQIKVFCVGCDESSALNAALM